MKKVILGALVMATIGVGNVMAQNTKTNKTVKPQSRVEARQNKMNQMTPEKISEIKTARLDRIVGLSPDQKKSVAAAYLMTAKQHQGRVAERKKTRDEVNSILDKDQLIKLNDHNQERMAQMKYRNFKRGNSSK